MTGQKQILVYAARHGTTNLNKADAFRGPIDAPLDKSGYQDAHKLATLFEPIDISAIVHSDKKRTRETAKTIAAVKGITVHPNPDLAAWNVGDLGGQPKNEENLEIVKYHVDHPDVSFPGGESLNQFKARIHPLIQEAVDIGLETGVPVLLVVHSSVIHEIGTMIGGYHEYALVEPGGAVAIYIQDGKLDVEPIFKPRPETGKHRAENMT